MNKLGIYVVLVVMLSACSTWNAAFGYTTKDLNIAKTSMTLANDTARLYVSLPLCNTPKATVICSNITTIVIIGKTRAAAEMAITAAETAQTQNAIGQAITAVNAFTDITKTLKTGE